MKIHREKFCIMEHLDAILNSEQQTGPESLADMCYRTISDNLDIISVQDGQGDRTLREGLRLPSEICDRLIEFVQRSSVSKANDAFFAIFMLTNDARLKRVKIGSSLITDLAIMRIMRPEVTHLELNDCRKLSGISLEHINTRSKNLYSLTFRDCPEIMRWPAGNGIMNFFSGRGYVFDIPKLRRLAIDRVVMPMESYHLLLRGLNKLTHLDLPNATDIQNFNFLSAVPALVSLCFYNTRITVNCRSFIDEVVQLKKLRHLDISHSNRKYGCYEKPNEFLSELVRGLPELVSLDISGTNLAGRGVAEHPLDERYPNDGLCDIQGLASRVRKPLQFLGLYGTHHGACRRHDIPASVIAGNANEDQILIALKCMNYKQELLQKVLNDLYHVFRHENCKRMDQALYMVLEAMEKHVNERHIQIAGSATLYYIIRMKEKGGIHAQLKRRIIGTLIAGMNAHRDDEPMMRNGCMALCQFRIPHDVLWSYETLVKILLHSARHAQSEGFVQNIGIHLLNSLACQVEGKEKRLLGKLGCVEIMLSLVKYRVRYNVFDDVLEMAWSIMWNMTDETPINCERFLDEQGMMFFLLCVQSYPWKEELLRNIMGLLGNVAEVDYLRWRLMQHQYVTVFARLLSYDSDLIEVSYSATGILAHMASDGEKAWTVSEPTRSDVLESMVKAIERWDLSAQRIINYRSFLPLLRLLDVYHTPQCQHWAVWALANLTQVYPTTYCSLVEVEGGIEKLNNLIKDARPYARIKDLANLVISNCANKNSASAT